MLIHAAACLPAGRLADAGACRPGPRARRRRVADLLQGQPVRRQHASRRGRARRARSTLGRPTRPAGGPRRPRPGSPTSARTMWWQKASARTVATARPVRVARPRQVEQRADGGGALAPLAERREVVLAEQRRPRPRSSASRSSGRGQASTCPPHQRVDQLRAVGDPVGVAPPQGREPRVEAVRATRRAGRTRTSSGSTPLSRRTQRRGGRRRRPADRGERPVGSTSSVHDLAAGVHPGVGAPGAGERRRESSRSTWASAVLEQPCDGAQPRLGGPAVEVGAVVGEVESQPHPDILPHRDVPARARRRLAGPRLLA